MRVFTRVICTVAAFAAYHTYNFSFVAFFSHKNKYLCVNCSSFLTFGQTDVVTIKQMEPRSRIELETSSLPWMRSTTELPGQLHYFNRHSLYYKTHIVGFMVQSVGFGHLWRPPNFAIANKLASEDSFPDCHRQSSPTKAGLHSLLPTP